MKLAALFSLIFCANALSQTAPFVVITSLYNETNKARMAEYIDCMDRNVKHPMIRSIRVLYDTSRDDQNNTLLNYLQSLDIQIDYIVGRPTYARVLQLANDLYPLSVVIIANADIYFDETLAKLQDFDFTNSVITLTRWNDLGQGVLQLEGLPKWKNYMTSDVWIVKTPCAIAGLETVALGTWQCDGLFHLKAMCSGYSLYNLCYDIRACHLHASQKRNYKEIIVMQSHDIPEIPWKKLSDFTCATH